MGCTDIYVLQGVISTALRYRIEILEPYAWIFRGALGAQYIFRDDTSRPHKAELVQVLEAKDNQRGEWTARYPNLNPIQHVWDDLSRVTVVRHPLPRNLSGAKYCLNEGVVFIVPRH